MERSESWGGGEAELDEEYGWKGESLASLTGSEEYDEVKTITRRVWYQGDDGELRSTVTKGRKEEGTQTREKDKRWIYCMEEEGKKIEKWEQEKHMRALKAAGITRKPIEKKQTESDGPNEVEDALDNQMK